MAKNITIKENGTAKTFSNVDIVGTRVDSGSGDWIPEDNAKTTWKCIRKNGQYIAMERDKVRGYTAVFVNVPLNRITGVDRNDGNTYEVYVDGQGNIVKRQID